MDRSQRWQYTNAINAGRCAGGLHVPRPLMQTRVGVNNELKSSQISLQSYVISNNILHEWHMLMKLTYISNKSCRTWIILLYMVYIAIAVLINKVTITSISQNPMPPPVADTILVRNASHVSTVMAKEGWWSWGCLFIHGIYVPFVGWCIAKSQTWYHDMKLISRNNNEVMKCIISQNGICHHICF